MTTSSNSSNSRLPALTEKFASNLANYFLKTISKGLASYFNDLHAFGVYVSDLQFMNRRSAVHEQKICST